ncbi:TIGR03936 family radical SAM-associated protein [Senegalia massiliensis]|uniref:TIGR03936 family radical SAM-associated protein n=1 Tax=Senegalia massiliensis TaxID=1720316 RepID=UPI0013EEFF3C|nr:TIGR03936 family radical SAM-associated protein [Senegalia massiliensis]
MLKLRVKFKKYSLIRYISHLDLMRLFQRAFRRANIPVEYSKGFNPQPKFSFATALALGLTSDGEYMDIELQEEIAPEKFIKDMNDVLPEGVEILEAHYTDDKKSLMSIIKSSSYIIELIPLENSSKKSIYEAIDNFKRKKEIYITKSKKKKGRTVKKEVDIRKNIYELDIILYESDRIILKTLLKTGSTGNLKPELLIKALIKEGLQVDNVDYNIHRLDLFTEDPKWE